MTKKEQKKEQQPTQEQQQFTKYSEIDKLRFEIRNLKEQITELNKILKSLEESFKNITKAEEYTRIGKLLYDFNREYAEKVIINLEKLTTVLEYLKDDLIKVSEDLHFVLVRQEEIKDIIRKAMEKGQLLNIEDLKK